MAKGELRILIVALIGLAPVTLRWFHSYAQWEKAAALLGLSCLLATVANAVFQRYRDRRGIKRRNPNTFNTKP